MRLRIDEMNKITYKVVKHDGGWAYKSSDPQQADMSQVAFQ